MQKYYPLFALVIVALLAATALALSPNGGSWMSFFMGFALCQFALLKLFHIKAFAKAFAMYDILAKKSPVYALAYPFIELGL